MIFPLESLSDLYREFGMVAGVLVGFCFGFVLERAGFGRATKLAAQFYLNDMTVFKVMFSAIVTAMLGLVVADGLGLADFGHVARLAASNTFIWPMLVGGLLLGVGFIVSGYCPGTSLVSAASGHYDGMLAFAGVIIGSVLFGFAYPLIADFYVSGAQGQIFFYEVLGVPPAVVAIAVVIMAVGCFVGADKVEKIVTERFLHRPVDPQSPAPRRFAFASFGVVGLAGLAMLVVPVGARETASTEVQSTARPISVQALAGRILDEPWKLRIIDLRPEQAFIESRIPGSENSTAEGLSELGLQYSRGIKDLVLVGADDLPELPAAAAAYPGQVLLLQGGFEAWRRFALAEPTLPASDASEQQLAAYRFQAAVHSAVTGVVAPPPPKSTVKFKAPPKRSGGGCS